MTDPFNEKELTKTLKKAKQRTLLKMTVVALLISVAVIAASFYGHRYWMGKIQTEVMHEKVNEQAFMSSANTFTTNVSETQGFLKGTMTQQVYKIIEDTIIPWNTQTIHYTNKGFESTTFTSTTISVDDTTEIHIPDGQRIMQFYVPQYQYKTYENDLANMKQYPDDKYIEMAISFEDSFPFEHVQKMLPKELHVTWYWVNDFDSKKQKRDMPELDGDLYGFSAPNKNTTVLAQKLLTSEEGINTPERFLEALKTYSKEDYELLKKRQHKKFIAGVVVTGTKKDLAILKNQSYIKSSSIGAVVDKN